MVFCSSLVSKHDSHSPASGPFAFAAPFIWILYLVSPWQTPFFLQVFIQTYLLSEPSQQPICWWFQPLTSHCLSLFLAFSFLTNIHQHLAHCLFTFLIMFITLCLCLFYSQFISCACKSAWHIVRTRQVLVEWMNPLEPILRNVLRPLVTLVSETMICSSLQGMQMWIVTYLLKATSNISPYLVLLLT